MALLDLLPIKLNPYLAILAILVAVPVFAFVVKQVLRLARWVSIIGCFGIVTVGLLAIIVLFERR